MTEEEKAQLLLKLKGGTAVPPVPSTPPVQAAIPDKDTLLKTLRGEAPVPAAQVGPPLSPQAFVGPIAPARPTETQLSRPGREPSALSAAVGTQDKALTEEQLRQQYTRGGDPSLISRAITPQPFIPETQFPSMTSALPFSELRAQDIAQAARTGQAPTVGSVFGALRPRVVDPFATVAQFEPAVAEFEQLARTPTKDPAEIEARVKAIRDTFSGNDTVSTTLRGYYEAAARGLFPEQDIPAVSNSIRQVVARETDRSWFEPYVSAGGVRGALARAGQIAFSPKVSGQDLVEPGIFTAMRTLNFPFAVAGGALEAVLSKAAGDPTPLSEGIALSARRYVREGRGLGDAVSQGAAYVASPLGDTAESIGAVTGFGLGFIADAFAPGKLGQLASTGYKAVGKAQATSKLAKALDVVDSGGLRSVLERATEATYTQVIGEVAEGTRKLPQGVTNTRAAVAEVRQKLYKQIADEPSTLGLLLDDADTSVSARFIVPKDIVEELKGSATNIDEILEASTDPRVLEKAQIGSIIQRMASKGADDLAGRLAQVSSARRAASMKQSVFTPKDLQSYISQELEALDILRGDAVLNPAISEVVESGRNELASIFDTFRVKQQRLMKEKKVGFEESFYRIATETPVPPKAMWSDELKQSVLRQIDATAGTPAPAEFTAQVEAAMRARNAAHKKMLDATKAKRAASFRREVTTALIEVEDRLRTDFTLKAAELDKLVEEAKSQGYALGQLNLPSYYITERLEGMRVGLLPSSLQRDDFFARYIDTIFGGNDTLASTLKTRGGPIGEDVKPEVGYWLSRAVQDTPAMREIADKFHMLLQEGKTKDAMALLEAVHLELQDLNVVPAVVKAIEEGYVHPTTMYYLNRSDALVQPRGVKLPATRLPEIVALNYSLDEQRKIVDRVAARLAEVAPSVLTPPVMDLAEFQPKVLEGIVAKLLPDVTPDQMAQSVQLLSTAFGEQIHLASALDALDYLVAGEKAIGQPSPRLSAIVNALERQNQLVDEMLETIDPVKSAQLKNQIALTPDEWRTLTPGQISETVSKEVADQVGTAFQGLSPEQGFGLKLRIEEAERILKAGPIVDTPATRLERVGLPAAAKRQLLSAQSIEDMTATLDDLAAKGKAQPTKVLGDELYEKVQALTEGGLEAKRAEALSGTVQSLDLVNKISYLNNLAKGGVLNGFMIPNMVYHAGNIMSAPFIMNTTLGPERTLKSVGKLGSSLRLFLGGGGPDEIIVRNYTRSQIEDMLARGSIMRSRQRADLSQSMFRDFNAWQQDSIPKKLWRTLDPGSPTSYLARFADSTDAVFRTSTVLSALEEGMPPEQAIKLGREALLDYGKLTDLERQTLAKYLWFYTFWSKNLTATLNATLTRPGSIAAQYRIMNGLDRSTNATADDMSYASPWADTRIFRQVLYDPDTAQRYALTGTDVPALTALADIMEFGSALASMKSTETAEGVKEFLPGPGLLPQWILGLGLGVTWDSEPVSNYVDPRLLYWAETFGTLDALQAIVPMEKESDLSKTRGRTTFRGEVWKVKPEHERTWFALQQAMLTTGVQRTVRDWAPLASEVTGTDIRDFRLQSQTPTERALRAAGVLRTVTDPTRTERRRQIERERAQALKALK